MKNNQDNNCGSMIERSYFCTSADLRLSYLYCEDGCHDKNGCPCNRPLTCKPSVVLLHGVGSNANYWLCLMKELCPIANVYALDLPVAGESATPVDPVSALTLSRLTQDVAEFLEHIGLECASFVGHGLGGLIALNYSILYPDQVNRIVTAAVNPKSFPEPNSNWAYYINLELLALLDEALAPGADIDAIAPLVAAMVDPIDCSARDLLINQYINAVEQYRLYSPAVAMIDFRTMVTQVPVPVLVTGGTCDPYAPLGATLFLQSQIVDSALVEFYEQGYNFPIFNTNLFNKHVLDFFFVNCDPCCAYLESIKKPCCECDCGCDNVRITTKHPESNKYKYKYKIAPQYT